MERRAFLAASTAVALTSSDALAAAAERCSALEQGAGGSGRPRPVFVPRTDPAPRRRRMLRGFRAEVDPVALGFGIEAMVAIRLKQHTRADFESFRAYALAIPEAIAVYHMWGEDDFLIHVAARDAHHLRDMASDYFTTRPEVGHLETALIFEHRRGPMPV